jgi:hypothetical protein
LPDGTVDSSFGSHGVVATTFGLPSVYATCIAIQADGRILVGGDGKTTSSSSSDFAIARFWP